MAGVHRHDQVTARCQLPADTGHPRPSDGVPAHGRPACQACRPFAICPAMTTVYRSRTCTLLPSRHEGTQAMARTATQASPRLIALALPGIPGSVPAARRHVRDALGSHGLGEFAQDAAIITSELVANAVQHACGNGAARIGVTLTWAGTP